MNEPKSNAGAKPSAVLADNEYHFPGAGIWEPMSIKAPSLEEAGKIWEQTNKLINPII